MTVGKTMKVLFEALGKALDGQTVLVVGSKGVWQLLVYTPEFEAIPAHRYVMDLTNDQIHFQPKGSLRFFTQDSPEWDEVTQRIRSYPAEVPVYVL